MLNLDPLTFQIGTAALLHAATMAALCLKAKSSTETKA